MASRRRRAAKVTTTARSEGSQLVNLEITDAEAFAEDDLEPGEGVRAVREASAEGGNETEDAGNEATADEESDLGTQVV